MKKYLSFLLIICLILSLSTASFASSPAGKSLMEDQEFATKILSSEYAGYTSPKYISVEEYLTKYGTNNIIKGLNKAKIENKVKVLKTATVEEQTLLKNDISAFSTEPNEVYLSMLDGKFLGMQIVGISDLPPDDIKLSFKLKKEDNNDKVISISNNAEPTAIVPYTNYDVYYKTYAPDVTNDLEGMAYEPKSGSYMYKYSLWFDNNCLVESDVVFNNTKLYCGNQANNMYTYVAAKSQYRTLDFGLMANPTDNSRNQGMYMYYNNGKRRTFTLKLGQRLES